MNEKVDSEATTEIDTEEVEANLATERDCSLNCDNDGYCVINPITSSNPDLLDGKLREICFCQPGFTGITCQQHIRSMHKCTRSGDTRVCPNGGFCRQVLNNIVGVHEWMCDCIVAKRKSDFAGYMCQHPSTEYCNVDGSSYCTNGGTCAINMGAYTIQDDDEPEECLCPEEFEGPHCEFLIGLGSGKKSFPTFSAEVGNTTTANATSGATTLILIFGLGAVPIVGYVLKKWVFDRRNRGADTNNVVDNGQEDIPHSHNTEKPYPYPYQTPPNSNRTRLEP